MSDAGWANFTNTGLPYTAPGPIFTKYKNGRSQRVDLSGYTRIDNGQCVTFVEWMTNTCNSRVSDYVAGKYASSATHNELVGRAIAKFECTNSRGMPSFCQTKNNYGHIVVVLAKENDGSAWVVDSNTLPDYDYNYGGVIAKRKMSASELSRYRIVTFNTHPNQFRCK